jgi:hypothetical protein
MCCWRTDSGICSLKLSSVGHCTAAAGSRFHCTMVFTRTRLIFFYKIIYHLVAIYPINLLVPSDSRTRQYTHSHSYRHIHTSLDSYKYSFYPQTIVQWNHDSSCCCTMSHTWQLQRTDTTICSPTTHLIISQLYIVLTTLHHCILLSHLFERYQNLFYPTHARHIIVNKMTVCGNTQIFSLFLQYLT